MATGGVARAPPRAPAQRAARVRPRPRRASAHAAEAGAEASGAQTHADGTAARASVAAFPRPRSPARYYALPLSVAAACVASAAGAAPSMLAPGIAFVVVPLVDAFLGEDTSPPLPDDGSGRALPSLHYRAPLLTFAFVAMASLPYCCARFCVQASAALAHTSAPGALGLVALVLSSGVVGGLGINAAHELVHSTRRSERVLARVLLSFYCYVYWATSHLSHHRHVGLPERDSATAALGETVWGFAARAPAKNLRLALHDERRRLRRAEWVLGPSVVCGTLCALYGPLASVFYAAQAAVAVFLLETVNFVEHYGLQRQSRRKSAPPSTEISWNGSWPASDALLFNLQRHADHHDAGRASVPYERLRLHSEGAMSAPRLPASYPVLILLSVFMPPLYSRLMDGRAREANARARALYET